MKITRADWGEYVRKLSAIDSKAASLMKEFIAAHGNVDPEALVRYAFALVTKFGEASGALACQMYDEVAAAQGALVPPAVPADTATFGETAKAVRGTWNQSPDSVPATTSRLVKQVGADTILKNAERDGAQFAWVPSGDTCIFCRILASRGWQRISAKALKKGHAEHIHANCDCTYAVRFDGKSGVNGYDPDQYKKMYESAKGKTSREKINSMRREQYAENKDLINEQKRMRYAERKADKAELLRNNLPKNYVDKRVVGHQISKDEYNSIVRLADEKGIRLGANNDGSHFDLYCGDLDVLENVINEVSRQKSILGIENIILEYDNVLGFEGDNSKIDIGAFSQTKGNTIRLNKFMFDSSSFLRDQYNEAVETGLFAPGTTYINCVHHEFGHIIGRDNNYYRRTVSVLQKEAERDNVTVEDYIKTHISAYGASVTKEGRYSEVIPELLSMANGTNGELAIDILRKVGISI